MDEAAPVAVVLGAGGLLGSALCRQLPADGWRLVAAPHAACDIRDAAALRALLEGARPAVVFNAAAFTDVDRAELEPELARAVNAEAPETVARVAADTGAKIVHYSTDFVFDGQLDRPYHEGDRPSPLCAYARTKAEGDARLAAASPRHVILRVGGLYQHGGRNFPSRVAARLRAGETIRADDERRVAPTWIREVAAVSSRLARTEHQGLFHCMAHGETTWAGFARRVAELLGLRDARIQSVGSDELALRAARPRCALLDNRALQALGLDTLSRWDAGLRSSLASTGAAGQDRAP
ncbi:MAG TPA: dTDP-4-dehydrorhamnose reductase [Polyangia bacterium]|nr:dTDP-4-dehydrorhamnose reductase [Polyangia bacterium]